MSIWDSLSASSPPIDIAYGQAINVQTHGAIGDGITDDTEAIQDALDMAALDGGNVFMPSGIYKTTTSLTIPPRVYLIGAGPISTSFDADLTMGTTTIKSSFNGSVVKFPAGWGGGIQDLMILGDVTQSSQILLDLGDPEGDFPVTRFTVRRVHLKGAGLDCLFLRGVLLECHFDQIYAHAAERYNLHAFGNDINVHKFTNCIFREAKQWGIRLVAGSYHFDTCVIESNSRHATLSYGGLWIDGVGASITDVLLSACWFENNKGVSGDGISIKTGPVNPSLVIRLTEINTVQTGAKSNILENVVYVAINGNYSCEGQPAYTVLSVYPCVWFNPSGFPQFSLTNTSGKGRIISGLRQTSIPAVASASTITLPGDEFITITGTTTVNTITAANLGDRVTIVFTSAVPITEAGNVRLSAAFTASADDILELVCDGTNWFEVGRSVN